MLSEDMEAQKVSPSSRLLVGWKTAMTSLQANQSVENEGTLICATASEVEYK